MSVELSIVILALNEEENVRALFPSLRAALANLRAADGSVCSSEILVVDGGSTDRTREVAAENGARVIVQRRPGYGGAFREGIFAAAGKWIATLDADCSHPANVFVKLWEGRTADIMIGSRYVPGGSSLAPVERKLLSRWLNRLFRRVLDLPVHDLSSGLRLYRRSALAPESYSGEGFDILIEALVVAWCRGYGVAEMPFAYQPRRSGSSHAKLLELSFQYLFTIKRLWKLRNAATSADYDSRAYDSIIPLQRYWQRKRCFLIRKFLGESASAAHKILDIGCGSSRIIQSMPHAVGFDFSPAKLRFLARANPRRIRGSTFALPFRDSQFDAVLHSQVIEHVPFDRVIFREVNRVMRNGGRLVIGTPDYGRVWWPVIEYFYGKILPNAYADEHITHYTKAMLLDLLAEHGFRTLEYAYICGGELIIRAEKVEDLGSSTCNS